MKAVQVMFDEDILALFDESEEVKKEGRSAVLRRAVREYLDRRHRVAIAVAYRQAYGEAGGLGEEYEGWEEEGKWPDE